MENEKINEEKTDEVFVIETSEQEVSDVLNEKQLEMEEEDCRDPIDFLEEESKNNLSLILDSLYKDKYKFESLICELRKEIQEFEKENKNLKIDNEDLNKDLDEFQNSETQSNLVNLISAINAASNAYEKVSTEQVRGAAKGLALAAIGKLHMFIDKI